MPRCYFSKPVMYTSWRTKDLLALHHMPGLFANMCWRHEGCQCTECFIGWVQAKVLPSKVWFREFAHVQPHSVNQSHWTAWWAQLVSYPTPVLDNEPAIWPQQWGKFGGCGNLSPVHPSGTATHSIDTNFKNWETSFWLWSRGLWQDPIPGHPHYSLEPSWFSQTASASPCCWQSGGCCWSHLRR